MLGSKELRVPLIADTLFVDTDRAVVTLTWRGLVLVDERAPRLTVAVGRTPGRASMPPAPPNEGRASLLTEIETTHVETPDGGVMAASLPFTVPEPNARATVPDYDDDALPFRTPDADLATTKPRPALSSSSLLGASSLSGGASASPPPPPPPPPSVPPERASFAGTTVSSPPPRPSFASTPPSSPPPRPSFASTPAPPPSPRPSFASTPAPPRPSGGGWVSLRAASDAAAESAGAGGSEDRKADRDRVAGFSDAGSAQRRHALVDLLAHDPALPQRLRRVPAFAKVIAETGDRPAWVRPDEAREEPAGGDRDRRDVLRVLSFVAPCDLPRVREIVEEAFDDAAQLDLPLVVVMGQLKPTHDELAILRATVQAGQPLSGANKALQAALKVLQEAIDGGVAPPGEATAALLRQAEQAAGPLWGYLFAQVQRAVLEERHFKKRTVLGEPRIRADLTTPSGETVPAYVPAAVASKLPMLPSFPAVVLGELRPREDAQETHAEAFLVWALGRVVRQSGARGK
jgi:hypothetical protein